MIDKIKHTLIIVGIFALIFVFYATGQKMKLDKLKKLLGNQYKKKNEEFKTKRKELKKEIKNSKDNGKEIKKEIEKIDKKKKEIIKNVKKLDKADLSSAIGDWYKSRK